MLNVSATKPVIKKKRVAPELPTEIYAKRLKMKLGTSSIGTPHVTEQGGNIAETSCIAGCLIFRFASTVDILSYLGLKVLATLNTLSVSGQ